jgi:predicted peptidase
MALGTAIVVASCTGAWYYISADTPHGAFALFTYDSLSDDELGEMSYAVYVPPGYSDRQTYPLVVSLHGHGERGTDGRKQLTIGLAPFIAARSASHNPVDFFALFPQSYTGLWLADSADDLLTMKVLERVCKRYRIDVDRIYLTGISSGGDGVWHLAAKHPDKWAAIVPLGGGAMPGIAPSIKHIPCWCFHGKNDTSVRVEYARNMMAALREAGGQPRYTEYQGRGHDVWLKPYLDPKLFEWLLDQRKSAGIATGT